MDGYHWLSPDVANGRVKNPDGRRQQLIAALMEQPQGAGTQQPHAGD